MVHLHRHRRLAWWSSRSSSSSSSAPPRPAPRARPPPVTPPPPERRNRHVVQPPQPQLPQGARLHPGRAAASCCKLSADLKAAKYGGYEQPRLPGKNIALIFEKTSTRTRTAFEVAAKDQGAHVTYLEPSGSQIGHKESMKDTARVLGRTFDGIEYRGFAQENVEILAEYAGVPVWNGLTDEFHPTQILADVLTMTEHSDKHLTRHRLLLPRRRPQQHGQLADGRRLQVRHGRPAVRPARPVAARRPGRDLPRRSPRRPAPGSRSPRTSTRASRASTSSTPTSGSRWARTRASGRSGSSCSRRTR